MKVIIVGIQGSGKSTQGNLLSKKLDIPYLSTGHIMRHLAQEKTQLGRYIKEIINSGELVPDKRMLPIVEEYLEQKKYLNGFILDGFPRTSKQAEEFTQKIDAVIYLEVSDKEALWRLSYRDDDDGREDDTITALRKRIELFHRHTAPVLDYYRKKRKLITIDGEQDIKKIHKDILAKLRKKDLIK